MINLDTPALKPCPFCGTDPDWKRWEVGGIWQIKIFCDGGGCHVHPSIFGNEKTMTEIWNTRTPDPQRVRDDALEEAASIKSFSAKHADTSSVVFGYQNAIRALKEKKE